MEFGHPRNTSAGSTQETSKERQGVRVLDPRPRVPNPLKVRLDDPPSSSYSKGRDLRTF